VTILLNLFVVGFGRLQPGWMFGFG